MDLDTEVVEVWTFGDRSPEAQVFQRFADSLPVRLGSEEVGEIDQAEVFAAD